MIILSYTTFDNTSEQHEKLSNEIKRWTYKGRFTKKAQKLLALQQSMTRAVSMSEALLDQK